MRCSRAAIAFLVGFCSTPARAQDGADDAASRAELILELARGLEKDAAAEQPSVLAGVDLEWAAPEVRKVAQALKETRVTIALEKQSLEETLELLRRISGVTFVVSPRARRAIGEEKPEMTLSLKDLPLENVLNLLALHLGDYRFQVRYGAVMLVRAEEYRRPLVTRVYDISDLTRPKTDFPAPKLGLASPDEK